MPLHRTGHTVVALVANIDGRQVPRFEDRGTLVVRYFCRWWLRLRLFDIV